MQRLPHAQFTSLDNYTIGSLNTYMPIYVLQVPAYNSVMVSSHSIMHSKLMFSLPQDAIRICVVTTVQLTHRRMSLPGLLNTFTPYSTIRRGEEEEGGGI